MQSLTTLALTRYCTKLALSKSINGLRVWNEARRAARHQDAIFIHIPKNAGTSVSSMLREHGFVLLHTTRAVRYCFRNAGRVNFGHMTINALVEAGLVRQEFVNSAFKFAVVRNPYDRAISLYRHMAPWVCGNWHRQPSFQQFLRLLADGLFDRNGIDHWQGLSLCNPQVSWLHNAGVNMIYRFEEIHQMLDDLRARWAAPEIKLPLLNQRSHATAAIDLSQQDRELIEQIYAADFDELGYSRHKVGAAVVV